MHSINSVHDNRAAAGAVSRPAPTHQQGPITHHKTGSLRAPTSTTGQRGTQPDPGGDAAVFCWQGRRTAVIRDHNGLLLEQLPVDSCLPWCSGGPSSSVQYVPYSEILCCRYLPIRRYCPSLSACQRKQRHYMELQVLRRHPSRPWLWGLQRMELAAEEAEVVKAWVAHTRQQLQALSYRPRRLLVFVNPYGGKRQAQRTWAKLAEPIVSAAGVEFELIQTQYQGHARECVGALSSEQLQQLDGIVAVGGDGLFGELLTAVLQHRHLSAALQLRLGHIPAGSTDAVACTLHGTRDAVTAALHIALGDCTALDVGRMVALPPPDSSQQQEAGQLAGAAAGVQPIAAAGAAGGTAAGAAGSPKLQQVSPNKAPVGAWDWGLSAGSQAELLPGGADVPASQVLYGAAASAPVAQTHSSSSAGASSTHGRRSDKRKQQQKVQHKRQQQAAAAATASSQQQQQQQDVSMYVPHLQHFVCVANYGFLGDVMETSERLRWCGPIRYDLAGVLRFLTLRKYKATVWYKPAPQHDSDDSNGASHAQQQRPEQQQQHQNSHSFGDTLVSPAAVSPLPHHRVPALHARLSLPSTDSPWQQHALQQQQHHAQQQQQQQQQEHQVCCEHYHAKPDMACSSSSRGSSESGSRRSSMDFSSQLVTVTEGGAVQSADAATGNNTVTAGSNTVITGNNTGRSAGGAAAGPLSAQSSLAGAAICEVITAPISSTQQQQQQQQKPEGKSVSFPAQPTSAVHPSGASYSSRGNAGGALAAAIAAATAAMTAGGMSRASSVTSQASTSRCHSRCSRCSSVAMLRSASRQNFAALNGAVAEAVPAASAPAATATAVTVPAPTSNSSSHPSSPSSARAARSDGTADGIVRVLPHAAAAAPADDAVTVPSCSKVPAGHAEAGSSTTQPPAQASGAAATEPGAPGPGWVKVEGDFTSIMCVVTSCISDKSRQGLLPDAHLADGRLALVLVQGCSRLQYLRFLTQLATKGIVPGSLPFVRMEFATEVQVDCEGAQSSWNVDGELLRHGRVNVGIHAGLVDVFARGVELM